MMPEKKVEIMDCTIRDGGYINEWQFEKRMVREVYRALSKSGVDYVELGFRGTSKYFDPAVYGIWRFTTEDDLQSIVEGIEGAKIAIMGDYGKIDLEDFTDKKSSAIDLIRIAVNRDKVIQAVLFLEKIKDKGYKTSLQAMGFTAYSNQEKLELKKAVQASNLDYLYIADSYGSILPPEIPSIFDLFLDIAPTKVGFHPHNSLQMAFANTLEAMKLGVEIVDSTIYGMGRGAGNLPTEALIAYLQLQGKNKYNVIPILGCIEKYFIDLHKSAPWGYQLPYLISGMFKCHPYYADDLVKRREYAIEDIWKALEVIESLKPTGFDRKIIEKLITKGIISVAERSSVEKKMGAHEDAFLKPLQSVPYVNRHAGRDFLILANGPSLLEYSEKIQSFKLKYDPIVLGANYLSDLFIPDYHAFNNKKRFTMHIDSVNPQSQLLIGENIPDALIAEYVHRDYETLFFNDILDADFDIADGRIQSNCRTISVLLIGVSLVMGAKRVFIAGMDGYININGIKSTLFYDEKFEPADYDLNVERHQWNERFLHQIDRYIQAQGREGLHILTPTSHQTFYKGIENYL